VILLQAGVSALIASHTIAEPYGSLIVGGATLLIGIILALIGVTRLRADALVPSRTIIDVSDPSASVDKIAPAKSRAFAFSIK
jgi:hypothetical protein